MKKIILNDSKMLKTLMRDKLRLSIKQGQEGKIVSFTIDEFMEFSK